MKTILPLSLAVLSLLLGACQSPYYAMMEKVGVHKREILVDRVKEGKESQEEAKEQFQDALEQFIALTEFDGEDLQKVYDKLSKELDRCEDKADEIEDRIDSIENVSKALFREWEKELKKFTNREYQRISARKLEETRARYEAMIRTMHKARDSMEPVLVTFRDQVLFLKHNLNAQAIASLDVQVGILKSDIRILIHEMEASIDEAESFIDSMDQS